MKIVTNNPYRIVGILANSTEKEILKQKSKIKRFSEVGKEISSEYDFSFLPALQRNNSIINKAFSDIEQNQDKVAYSLFWFTNLSPVDNTAIQHLIDGNRKKALEIWEKLTEGKEVNAKNISAFNNVGTLYLLDESKEKQKQGIDAKIKMIESRSFKNFVNTVADETFTIDANKQTKKFIDELLTQFKNKYSTTETIDLFSNCNDITHKYLSQKFTEEPIHKIETQVEQAKNNRIKDKGNALQFGTDLYKNTEKELTQLQSVLGVANLQYKMLADNVAKEILQCSIDYFNDSQEQGKNSNYLDEAMGLAKLADEKAVNKITKDRIKDNVNTLEEMKANSFCFFCNRSVAEINSSYKSMIYRETYRSPWYEQKREVRFQKLEVIIPRCKSCKQIHDSTSGWLIIGPMILFASIGLVLGLTAWGYWFVFLLVGGIVGLIITGIIVSIDESNKAAKNGIKKVSEFTEFKPIRKLLDNGWTTNEPTA